jgi:3-methyl-2-oxobutanoate hydroxymethyltransferase
MDKVTVPMLREMKRRRQKIVALTSYDYRTTQLLNEAGVDVILVGDSLGMVKLGYDSTLPVTVEDMIYHTRIVARGNTACLPAGRQALLVADMPYMSYHAAPADAVRNAGKMPKAGAQAVKIEGGAEVVPIIRALLVAKIPVMGHIGMTPQSVHLFGGYKVQGKEKSRWKKLVSDAKALENAGVFAVVIECVPAALGRRISHAIKVPTIGIGAGVDCDGQVLVVDDLLGMTPPPHPRFVKTYADVGGVIKRAAQDYALDVRKGKFPDDRHSYS